MYTRFGMKNHNALALKGFKGLRPLYRFTKFRLWDCGTDAIKQGDRIKECLYSFSINSLRDLANADYAL
jgi:hypothetical protein